MSDTQNFDIKVNTLFRDVVVFGSFGIALGYGFSVFSRKPLNVYGALSGMGVGIAYAKNKNIFLDAKLPKELTEIKKI